MAERLLTGTRVRNRRMDRGMRQAELARLVGISGSYLNLIEHNRRRIGAKMLSDLARILEIDESLLEDETSASVMTPLSEAASMFPAADAETARAEDLVARFPGWATLIGTQQNRIAQLEARVEVLGNRLAHDTQIAASLHEVISTATAIRSTASILADTPDLERDWQARFHSNIDADSARLALSSQALLGLLDIEAGESADAASAVEQAEYAMAALGYHLPDCEEGHMPDFSDQSDPAVRAILTKWAKGYGSDAARMPLVEFEAAARQFAFDPARLAARFGVPVEAVLRRLSSLAAGPDVPPMGLVVADAAGVILHQKPALDFRLPRSGAGCPLWPLYQALTQPGRPLHKVVRMSGVARTTFECFAIAGPVGGVAFGSEPQIEATMLVRPTRSSQTPDLVGPGCRLCPAKDCQSRRQPSILDGQTRSS